MKNNDFRKKHNLIFLLAFYICCVPFIARSQSKKHKEAIDFHFAKDAINFIVVGDWGRNGMENQRKVANAMAAYAKINNVQFIISTGDNFYQYGVSSINDKQWRTSYENIYTADALKKRWLVVLGNHDYMASPEAEVEYSKVSPRWYMPRRYYSSVVKSADKLFGIQFLFTDTSPFINEYYHHSERYSDLKKQDTSKQLKWIQRTLERSAERWKIVVGHHPIYSAGVKHGSTPELIQKLNPILEKTAVDFYFSGHDHGLQYLQDGHSQLRYFVSAGGSESKPTRFLKGISKFSRAESGFLLGSVTNQQARFFFISHSLKLLYHTTITK